MRNARGLVVVILLALPLSLASVVTAQDEPRPHPGGLVEAHWLIGRPVVNENSRESGRVESMWVDPKDGRIKELVISVGGVLGIGDKHKKVPWQDARIEWQGQKPIVRLSDAQLRAAERYEAPAASPRTDRRR
jgi:sporulation protein YlmC with PRC-barrel domain